jgi:asparagine synthase (glutamine-hydrolysing)
MMCGIVGCLGIKDYGHVVQAMAGSIAHRGPDSDGFYIRGPVAMGMRRLSVIDVAGGNQPIYNEDRTVAIVFNGEIYNYHDLRADLTRRGHHFDTRSDTEVIVHLYEEYGDGCVHHLRGMFAFALHDAPRDRVLIARDRLGVKPLYYHLAGSTLVFGSEIKSLLECPIVPRAPDLSGVDAYLTLRYSPGPESMFAGIAKLPAAYVMVWKSGEVRTARYWDPSPSNAATNGFVDRDLPERFAAKFEESVRIRMISDVPLGAFLSGGVDSTAIVAAMSRHSSQPVNTFSVGFEWAGDELGDARAVAERLGCIHREVTCREADMALLPRIVWALDEPVGDPIVVPMYLLAELARRYVTVALSGEGADEVLGGYLMHKTMLQGRLLSRFVPRLILEHIARPLVGLLPRAILNTAFDYPGALGPRSQTKVAELVGKFGSDDLPQIYEFLISLFDQKDKEQLYAGPLSPSERHALEAPDPARWPSVLQQILSLQYQHWLQDDILTKLDKMTMINSLEGRVPFLDHPFVEFANALPDRAKIKGRRNKAVLRDYVDRVLPGGIANRAKKAFYVPLELYLNRGPLKEMIEQCLSETSVRRRGWLEWESVKTLRRLGGSGDFMLAKQLFSLLALELWARIYLDREPGWV